MIKEKKNAKKIKVIMDCFIGVFSFMLLVLLIISFGSKDDGIVKTFNYSFFDVNGNSMEPKIMEGDYIAIDRRLKDKYDEGDIVSFFYSYEGKQIIVTHEIIDVKELNNSYSYVTKGVNNDDVDECEILHDKIIGEYTNFRIPLLGYVVQFSRTQVGYLVLVVGPLGVLLLLAVYELLKEVTSSKKEDA